MNVTLYLEDNLGKYLNDYAKNSGVSRNQLIREAIKEWINNHEIKEWPPSILNFKGIPDIIPFEAARNEFISSDEDPFK